MTSTNSNSNVRHICIDVGYGETSALAACVVFERFDLGQPQDEFTVTIGKVNDYVPGRFFERELPCIMAIVEQLDFTPATIVVDSHVRLNNDGSRLGLGGHLFNELNGEVPIIGAAKSSFRGLTNAIEIYRGTSDRPLFVTAAGMDELQAARLIQTMHGTHRIPTLLKRVDQLSRG